MYEERKNPCVYFNICICLTRRAGYILRSTLFAEDVYVNFVLAWVVEWVDDFDFVD